MMLVCDRLGLHYAGCELNPEYVQISLDREPVKFPHETKKAAKRRRRVAAQKQLEFEDTNHA